MGEGCSPEEGYSSKRQTSSKEESFKGSGVKHSVGTMDGAKANVCDSVTQQFAMQMGQKHGLAIKKLIETGEETTYEDPSYPTTGGDGAVATWKMKCKRQQDKAQAHDEKKELVFSSVLGRCDDAVIARLDSMSEC